MAGTIDEPAPRITRVYLDGWPALGEHEILLPLQPRRTVLVGRNAAGKSALLEGVYRGLREPLARQHRAAPHRFRIDLLDPDGKALAFEYQWSLEEDTEENIESDAPAAPPVNWTERCWRPDTDTTVWKVENARALIGDSAEIAMTSGTSLLDLATSTEIVSLPELKQVAEACFNVRMVRAGLPREDHARGETFFSLRILTSGIKRWAVTGRPLFRIGATLSNILRWHEEKRESFNEFLKLGQKIGAFKDIRVELFKSKGNDKSDKELAAIFFDGTNAGLLSDGTLRVIETLYMVLVTRPGALLLIEEPETGIHPGMLSSLLNVIEAYSLDRQILLSTHSPLLVSWASWQDLRLVERLHGSTTVRPLNEHESSQVSHYLHEEGTLGEFVYSGGLDNDT